MPLSDLQKIHINMIDEIKKSGGRIDKIYFCPHNIGGCNCRKPSSGLLDKAIEEFDIDIENSWVVGDSESDINLGESKNCRTIYIGDDHDEADYKVTSLKEAVDLIVNS